MLVGLAGPHISSKFKGNNITLVFIITKQKREWNAFVIKLLVFYIYLSFYTYFLGYIGILIYINDQKSEDLDK